MTVALLTVFLEEAVRYLTVVADEGSSESARTDALESLTQSIELLAGDDVVPRAKAAVEAAGRGDDGLLSALARELSEQIESRRQRVPATPSDNPVVEDTDAGFAAAFEPDEYRVLRSFFRDEAHELLEGVAGRLIDSDQSEFDEAMFDEVMRATHSLKGSAGTVGLGSFADAAHELEDAFDRVKRGKLVWSQPVADAFVEAIDAMREYVNALHDDDRARALVLAVSEKVGALGSLERREGSDVTVTPTRPGETSGEYPIPSREERRGSERRRDEQPMLRVDPARVDALMDSVGELVFDRTRIERRVRELTMLADDVGHTRVGLEGAIEDLASGKSALSRDVLAARLSEIEADLAQEVALIRRAAAALVEDTEALRRTGTALQDGLTSVRMQTVRTLFQMLAPQLRSIARAAGKRVKLFTAGGETEFDKAVAEQITDPLIQLLRNAVAHGIETTETRAQLGKPDDGQITIAARHEGSMVVLEVSDDGGGIDPSRLRQRLVSSGRWTQTRSDLAADDEVLRAIFDAGVSSRVEADQLAGRGFGLDAVRQTIARLGGEIRVRSTPTKGTTFTLRLPLTTAITNALLFKVGGNVYAVPNVHVVETVEVEASSPAMPSHLRTSKEPVPLVLLHEVLGAEIPTDVRAVPAVVIEYLGRRLGITCDKIVGPREIVLKNLGPLLTPLPLYAGGTISGSGKVQLILDPAALVHLGHPEPPSRARSARARGPSRVLVADDSRAIREAMSRMLERAGYVVDVAKDGTAAWNMLRQVRYDVLVTDLEMPDIDGFALIERVRDDRDLEPLPVIVISSRATPTNLDRASALGVASFLSKPVTHTTLVDALRHIR